MWSQKTLPDTQLIYFAFKFFNCKLLYCKIVTIQIASGIQKLHGLQLGVHEEREAKQQNSSVTSCFLYYRLVK